MKVAVAGPNGTLGQAVISNLIKSNISVTVLTRDAKKTAGVFPAVSTENIVETDYSSVDALAPKLQGHDAIVILIERNAYTPQIVAIDAAIAAGVRRIIPSSWGLDMSDPYLRTIPTLKEKLDMETYLAERARSHKGFVWTGILTGVFWDWALPLGLLVDPTGEGMTYIMDGGGHVICGTLLDDVGRAVVSALKAPEEAVGNKFLQIRSVVATQSKLLEWAKAVKPEAPWKSMNVDTEKMEKAAREAWGRGERDPRALRGFLLRAYALGASDFKHLDNELLGVADGGEELARKTLEQLIRPKS
ncbi:NAD(P)-binding protein [Eremomyces bilateralis CBS 781.70]|uniref:NAD(P)-binding protein n=1 Tax=Eremomyces bilateralis CBS 781.70 TaxID=1392243 RepID=A0A6G1GEA2_9PEZI|nr:NAD(P)-binding protein [Eremomyces bilateralis CBS 781.70]KAF1816354.1 NAD(P)-binding protein [Eremomyces bilateralis CBS 781.70]